MKGVQRHFPGASRVADLVEMAGIVCALLLARQVISRQLIVQQLMEASYDLSTSRDPSDRVLTKTPEVYIAWKLGLKQTSELLGLKLFDTTLIIVDGCHHRMMTASAADRGEYNMSIL